MSWLPAKSVYFIGYNKSGGFGLDHEESITHFVKCPNTTISRIFNGNAFSIYTDEYFNHIYSAWVNDNGECGVGSDDDKSSKCDKYFYKCSCVWCLF